MNRSSGFLVSFFGGFILGWKCDKGGASSGVDFLSLVQIRPDGTKFYTQSSNLKQPISARAQKYSTPFLPFRSESIPLRKCVLITLPIVNKTYFQVQFFFATFLTHPEETYFRWKQNILNILETDMRFSIFDFQDSDFLLEFFFLTLTQAGGLFRYHPHFNLTLFIKGVINKR